MTLTVRDMLRRKSGLVSGSIRQYIAGIKAVTGGTTVAEIIKRSSGLGVSTIRAHIFASMTGLKANTCKKMIILPSALSIEKVGGYGLDVDNCV